MLFSEGFIKVSFLWNIVLALGVLIPGSNLFHSFLMKVKKELQNRSVLQYKAL